MEDLAGGDSLWRVEETRGSCSTAEVAAAASGSDFTVGVEEEGEVL